MITEKQQKLKALAKKQDPQLTQLELKLDWTPLSDNGSSFKTTAFKQLNISRLVSKKTLGAWVFTLAVNFIALLISSLLVYTLFIEESPKLLMIVSTMLAFSLMFVIAGIWLIFNPKPWIFDKTKGWLWQGSKQLHKDQDFLPLKEAVRLSNVAAIQILPKIISDELKYTSWEFNLVCKNGKRINIMDHANKKSILKDAYFLSEFLSIPIWEISDY
ncbi:hypothetical protein GCM10009133_04580 [Cocleimonas flava]|uniref:Uncharacterized protein n=1 Tax=Cocleimonas flava TaxID=634765 RepID=A0A4R1F502_9GAMM|nr:hypothetical protein [Cocleimonas flava]TCJ86828.1 hypothetical protein EV695_1326 [Cocleimonas flava]